MPLSRTLTAMALGFLALTLVMGCVTIDTSTARGKEAQAVHNWALWYLSCPGQKDINVFLWLIYYFNEYSIYQSTLYSHGYSPLPTTSPWGPTSGSSIPVSFNTSGAQNTVNNLNTITVPPTLVPQAQVPPPPPPTPPPPPPTPPGPQPPP
jgi:hypothetical protein